MSKVKRLAAFALILCLVVLVVVFVLENNQPTTVSFLAWTAPQLPFAAYLILALLAGWGMGPVLNWFFGTRLRRRDSHS